MIQKLKRWINLSHQQAITVPCCSGEQISNSYGTVCALEQKEQTSESELPCGADVSESGIMQATAVPVCISEDTASTVEEPNEDERRRELGSDVVAEIVEKPGGGVKLPNTAYNQSAEGKPPDAQTEAASQGAAASDKNVPDFPLFPLSRGFCLSLTRALDSFRETLEKAHLPDSCKWSQAMWMKFGESYWLCKKKTLKKNMIVPAERFFKKFYLLLVSGWKMRVCFERF